MCGRTGTPVLLFRTGLSSFPDPGNLPAGAIVWPCMRRHGVSRFYSRIVAAVSAALASLLASVAVPAAVITAFAVGKPDPAAVARFAVAVAEPLAVLGAGAATFLVSRWAMRLSRDGRALVPWVGGASAAAIVGAAGWTRDFDWWTVVAAGLLPAVAILAGGRSVRPDPPLRQRHPGLPDALLRRGAALPAGRGLDPAKGPREIPSSEPADRWPGP